MRAVIGTLLVSVVALFTGIAVLVHTIGNEPVLAQVVPSPTAVPSPSGAPVAPASEPIHYPQCPADLQTPEQMAAVIGGDPGDWTVPEGWWGAWTLRSAEFEHLVWPRFGFFDSPAGMRVQHDIDASEASFHCEEPPTT